METDNELMPKLWQGSAWDTEYETANDDIFAAASDLPPLVGLAGRAGSGKSAAAAALPDFVNVKLAGPLKAMLSALLEVQGLDEPTIRRMIEGDLKEVASPYLGGKTPRYAMQTLGTEWGRDLIGMNFWVDAALSGAAQIRVWENQPVVIDDVRFRNEAEAIKAVGGKVILIERPTTLAELAKSTAHPSEELNLRPTHVVLNNGDLKQLQDQVREIAYD